MVTRKLIFDQLFRVHNMATRTLYLINYFVYTLWWLEVIFDQLFRVHNMVTRTLYLINYFVYTIWWLEPLDLINYFVYTIWWLERYIWSIIFKVYTFINFRNTFYTNLSTRWHLLRFLFCERDMTLQIFKNQWLSRQISDCHAKSVTVTPNQWLSRQISDCHAKSVTVTPNQWLSRPISDCHAQSVTVTCQWMTIGIIHFSWKDHTTWRNGI